MIVSIKKFDFFQGDYLWPSVLGKNYVVARFARVMISYDCILDFEQSGSMISLVNGPSNLFRNFQATFRKYVKKNRFYAKVSVLHLKNLQKMNCENFEC